MRLIDADAVLERIELACDMRCLYKDYKEPLRSKMCNCCELGDARMYVEDAPTVDIEQHGHWKRKFDTGMEWYECSKCGKKASVFWGASKLSKYCSNCGAKMDGVEE